MSFPWLTLKSEFLSFKWILLVSEDTIGELIRVLAYNKFGLKPDEIAPIIDDLTQISRSVEVRTSVQVINDDPTDNIFLSLAVDGRADVIVSGDHHLLNLNEFKGISIITVREFVTR